MSLLLSPIILFGAGMLGARLAKARRIWKPYGHFVHGWFLVTLAAAWALGLGLFTNAAWALDLFGLGPGEGTRWMVNSGLFALPAEWPLGSGAVVAGSVLAFALFPLWERLGIAAGFVLFGRSPKQTGILGLLR